jgi:hypothetical protein
MTNSHQTLSEIVEKIVIRQNLTIEHSDYPSLAIEPDIITKLEKTSSQLQEKYLISQIQTYLYDIYFSHSLMSHKEIAAAAARKPSKIENNTIDGIDINFYRRLQQSNTSKGYLDPDWQIVSQTDEGELIVVKDGLHLHIDRQQHLPQPSNRAAIGDLVAIYLPHNLVGRDTYIAVGDVGRLDTSEQDRSLSVELYFNFTPDAAVAIVEQLTRALNKLAIPFQFAILHHPALFYRYDAATLCLSQTGYLAAQKVLAQIYHTHQAEFFPHIPLFSKQLAPGLGIAEVPDSPATFGMQRCELIATGLFATMKQGQTVTADKLIAVRQEFTTAGIDWRQPYLNPAALDCYEAYSHSGRK